MSTPANNGSTATSTPVVAPFANMKILAPLVSLIRSNHRDAPPDPGWDAPDAAGTVAANNGGSVGSSRELFGKRFGLSMEIMAASAAYSAQAAAKRWRQ